MPLQTHEQAHKQNIMNNMWVTHTTQLTQAQKIQKKLHKKIHWMYLGY